MTLWRARFKSHPLWPLVDQLRETMNRLPLPESEEDQDALAYAGMVLELLEKRREDSDPLDISPAMLQSTVNAASFFSTGLTNVEAGTYTWSMVTPSVDDAVTSLGLWPPMKISHWLSGLSNAVEAFQGKTAEALDRTSGQAAEALDRTTSQTDEFRQVLAKLDEHATTLGTEVETERQRIAEAIATFTTEGQAAVRELIDEQESRIEANQSEWAEHLEAQLAKAAEHEAQMSEYKARSVKVLQAVGENSTATDYGTYAQTQRKSANVWRRIASAVFAVASVWFIVSSLPWLNDGVTVWEGSLSRLGVTAAVAGVGAYAARESGQHRRQERNAKKVQLVLIALEPFIANLPVTAQDEIRMEAAKAIFVIRATDDEPDHEPATTANIDLIRAVLAKVPDRTS